MGRKSRNRASGGRRKNVVLMTLMKNPNFVMGAVILAVLILLSVVGPYLCRFDYLEVDMHSIKSPPSMLHPFGTDDLGRDIMARIFYGGRYSLSLGILAVALGMVLAVIVGSAAGFFGGWVDNLLMRAMDVLSSIPGMLLSIVVAAALGNGFGKTIIAMAIGNVAEMSRILRAQIMSIRGKDYVQAAVATNCTNSRIIISHILPNSIMPMIVNATSRVGGSILFASSLSFIGLGVQPPEPEWGAMLAQARNYIMTYPYMLIFPGLFIALAVVSLTLCGDALQDAMDPKLRK